MACTSLGIKKKERENEKKKEKKEETMQTYIYNMSEEDLFIPIKIPIHTHILINWYYVNFLCTCIPVLAICQVIDF